MTVRIERLLGVKALGALTIATTLLAATGCDETCSRDTDCEHGQVCDDGVCVVGECIRDLDCGGGYECRERVCYCATDSCAAGDADSDVDVDTDGDSDVDGDLDADGDVDDGDVDLDDTVDSDEPGDPCGDGRCRDGETFCTCPDDCSRCASGSCSVGDFVTICAASFEMGSPTSDPDRGPDEGPVDVTLTRAFQILSTEVRQDEFEREMGYNNSSQTGCPGCPVEHVSWHEAAAYCNALTLDEADRCYDCRGEGTEITCSMATDYEAPYDCPGFRLPTEAEWELAARSGTTGSRYGVLDDIAWYDGNSDGRPHDAATREESDFHLYDMLGNVWEWCHDWYEDYPSGPLSDPWGPAEGVRRARRGGSFSNDGQAARAPFRAQSFPELVLGNIGFRVARTLAP